MPAGKTLTLLILPNFAAPNYNKTNGLLGGNINLLKP